MILSYCIDQHSFGFLTFTFLNKENRSFSYFILSNINPHCFSSGKTDTRLEAMYQADYSNTAYLVLPYLLAKSTMGRFQTALNRVNILGRVLIFLGFDSLFVKVAVFSILAARKVVDGELSGS